MDPRGADALLWAVSAMQAWGGACGERRVRTPRPRQPCTHAVVIHLLERLIADGPLKDDTLERVGLVTSHQLNTDHLSFPHGHVAEHLRVERKRWGYQTNIIAVTNTIH